MLENKTILITGGTGAIGAAICRATARQGADVAFTFMNNRDEADRIRLEIEQLGRRCIAESVSATDAGAIEAFVGQVEEQWGAIHVLVNNLGIVQGLPFALIEETDWDEVISINLKSMFLFSKSVLRGMIRRRSGCIINMGSIAGRRMIEVPVHYATSKAGVDGFTTSLAKEMSRYGIRVNAVLPGLIEGGIGTNVSSRQLEEYNRFCAMGRPGTPEEVAHLVAFIASDDASYMNGQSVVLDGGL